MDEDIPKYQKFDYCKFKVSGQTVFIPLCCGRHHKKENSDVCTKLGIQDLNLHICAKCGSFEKKEN